MLFAFGSGIENFIKVGDHGVFSRLVFNRFSMLLS